MYRFSSIALSILLKKEIMHINSFFAFVNILCTSHHHTPISQMTYSIEKQFHFMFISSFKTKVLLKLCQGLIPIGN